MHHSFSKNKGFGLVEIMVGVVIGMIASIIVFQVFEVTERQKRIATGGADAQTNGAYALYMMERDIRMAGFGLENDVASKCEKGKLYSYYADQKTPGPIEGLDAAASVMIEDGGTNPDQIYIVYYSNPADSTVSFPNYSQSIDKEMPLTSVEFKVSNVAGCKPGELAMVIQDGNCTLFGITKVSKTVKGEQQIHHLTSDKDTDADLYNPKSNYKTANNWPVHTEGSSVRCGLKAPFVRRYHLQNQSLAYQDNGENGTKDSAGDYISVDLAPNTVELQAQYGVAKDASSTDIEDWVDAKGAWAKDSLTKENGKRIKALRIAVVARSSEYEKPDPGQTCFTTTADTVSKWSDWADLDAVKNIPDWQCYRYKTFETVIPLRNVIWSGS
ncbi:PilW family protein [Azovibrio restrictus]|uniref:PilW family protein n=1 Tax=Azovibrio restrictus TaxID=146938 RepID=UPI0026EEF785|nr:PilW family protein [Azovibrio restrictus]